jgi:integrase
VVFTGMFGNYISSTYVNLQFKRLLRRHDFPDVHIHDLRHANASLLINMIWYPTSRH